MGLDPRCLSRLHQGEARGELRKSSCTFCPFSYSKTNLVALVSRQKEHPEATAQALMLEHVSLCLNPRGSLYRSDTLAGLSERSENVAALEAFQRLKTSTPWALYRVRRIYNAKTETGSLQPAKKGTVQRAVEKMQIFDTEAAAVAALHAAAESCRMTVEYDSGIPYLFQQRRGDFYPAREEYLVAAPAVVDTKARFGIASFDNHWTPSQTELQLA